MACAKVGRPKLHILLLGAFSSGKTTILREIMNDHNYRKRPVIPTLGMYKKNFSYHNYKVNVAFIKLRCVQREMSKGVEDGRRPPALQGVGG
jgi:GTPase SAR1 family protein